MTDCTERQPPRHATHAAREGREGMAQEIPT
jgi:hypothetical protein